MFGILGEEHTDRDPFPVDVFGSEGDSVDWGKDGTFVSSRFYVGPFSGLMVNNSRLLRCTNSWLPST